MGTTKMSLRLSLAGVLGRLLPDDLKGCFYRLSFVHYLISRFLSHGAPKGVSVVKVVGGLLEGWLLAVDLKCEKYYWLGTHEPDLQKVVSEFVRPQMVIYDIGANIGFFTLIFARLVGSSGKVFAFEPFPSALKRLRQQVELNHQQQVITVVPVAISDRDETEIFQIHNIMAMGKLVGSIGRDTVYKGVMEVQSLTLDSYIYRDGNPVPDVIKIDIEGGEVKALPGMERVLAEEKPTMLLEIHGQAAGHAVWSILKEHGYKIHRLGKGYSEIENAESLGNKGHILALLR